MNYAMRATDACVASPLTISTTTTAVADTPGSRDIPRRLRRVHSKPFLYNKSGLSQGTLIVTVALEPPFKV